MHWKKVSSVELLPFTRQVDTNRSMSESKARVRFIEQAILAQEEERARIARELHDGVGQSLTSLLVGLRALETRLGEGSEGAKLVAQLRVTAGQAIDEVRGLAQGLRPTALDDLGLPAAIERLVEEMATRHHLGIDVQVSGLDTEPRLSPPIEITIYRIVQEALHNVAKHAHASRASVVLERRADSVRLIVEDDGKGMGNPAEREGFGLQGMRERLSLAKGELSIESSPDEGTTIYATIPCPVRVPRRYTLCHGEQEVPLPPGEYVIGRSNECEIQLDGRRISRRHAKLMIGDHDAYVADLGSMNGVFLNGRRVEGASRLSDGDGLVVGDEQLVVRGVRRVEDGAEWVQERTLPGRMGDRPKARDVTERANMLEVVGAMALRWLEQGRVADAERLLTGHLRQVMEAARAKEKVRLSVAEASVDYSLRLAQATRNAGWVRYALELHERLEILPLESTVASLEALSGAGVGLPKDVLRSCGRLWGASVDSALMDRIKKLAG